MKTENEQHFDDVDVERAEQEMVWQLRNLDVVSVSKHCGRNFVVVTFGSEEEADKFARSFGVAVHRRLVHDYDEQDKHLTGKKLEEFRINTAPCLWREDNPETISE